MKLVCDLMKNNLQCAGQASKSRTKKSQINVGKNEKNEIFVVIQSADNKMGTKYNITNNLTQTFERFLLEGKCTIRLKQPPVEFAISNCDPLQLRIFIKIIKSGHLLGCDPNNKKLVENLPSVHQKLKSTDLALKGRSELCILSRRELCATNFSQLLVKLEIVGLDLQQIPLSVSRLTRLQTLNVSRNKLTTLPLTMTSQLRELIVASNLLGQAAYKTWKFFSLPQIIDNLQNLDLSGNLLPYVPMDICNLKQLVKLELGGNCIKRFPPAFGKLSRLRTLNLSNNKIEAVDTSFQLLNLDVLDISGNNRFYDGLLVFDPFPKTIVPSLFQAASIVVAQAKLSPKELPLSLQEELLTLHRCRCLKPVWHNQCSVIPLELSKITKHLISDTTDKFVTMFAYFCKERCKNYV